MKIFLAGIVQGSMVENRMHDQDYRSRLKEVLNRTLPGVEVFCPIDQHPGSLEYDEREGRSTFFAHAKIAADADCVVAYLPEASMGTAVEMWEAYNSGRVVLAISPMKENWAVRFLSDQVFESIEAFETFAREGGFEEVLGWTPAEPEDAEEDPDDEPEAAEPEPKEVEAEVEE